MTATADPSRLLGVIRGEGSPAEVYDAVAALLHTDPVVGVAVVFDVLATEPRIKPSRGLVIDPADDVLRRWRRRVAVAAALLDSPHSARVADELADELDHDPVFAADVAAFRRQRKSG